MLRKIFFAIAFCLCYAFAAMSAAVLPTLQFSLQVVVAPDPATLYFEATLDVPRNNGQRTESFVIPDDATGLSFEAKNRAVVRLYLQGPYP